MTNFLTLKNYTINLAQIRYITWESNTEDTIKIRKPTIFIWLKDDNLVKLEYTNEKQFEHHIDIIKLNLTIR